MVQSRIKMDSEQPVFPNFHETRGKDSRYQQNGAACAAPFGLDYDFI